MIQLIETVVTALSPILFVVALLGVAGSRERRREAESARQVRLTDALAAEMGAIVAPVVRKRWGARWRVEMAVPMTRPAVVGRIVSVAHRALERMGSERYEIVLRAQAPPALASAAQPGPACARLRVA